MENKPKFDKFIFETDFFEVAVQEEREAAENRLTEEDLSQAEATGFAAGVTKGREEAAARFEKEVAEHLAPLSETLQKLLDTRQTVADLAARKAIMVLRHLVEGVLKNTLTTLSPDLLEENIKSSLLGAMEEVGISLRVSPVAARYIRENEQLATLLAEKAIEPVEDDSLHANDCVVEWQTGGVAVRMAEILADLDKKLLAAGAGASMPFEEEQEEAAPVAEAPAAEDRPPLKENAPPTEETQTVEEAAVAEKSAPSTEKQNNEEETAEPQPAG